MTGNGVQGGLDVTGGAPRLEPPEIPGYEVLERIGRGGMGEVYVARQLTLGRLVAIKFLVAEGDSDPDGDLVRFRREANLMAQVSHPNILSIFDFGEVAGRPFLVMEYVEGGDLRRRMRVGEPLPPDEVHATIVPVGAALAYLHKHGIIHRDLKPENILLHDGHNPRVSDFGIAVLRAGAGGGLSTRTGRGLGTLGYIAPEQQYRLKVDERADEFSLAALAYEMLTGQLPLGMFKPPSDLNPSVSPEVDAVILRGLQEEPKARYATVREFADELGRALAACGGRPGRWSPGRLAWASAVCVVVVAGLIALRGTWHGREEALPRATITVPLAPSPLPLGSEPALDPRAEQMKQWRAHHLWIAHGRPEGAKGEALRETIWFEAVEAVQAEQQRIAYGIWLKRGRPEGPDVKDKFWFEAQTELYQTLKDQAAVEAATERAALRP